MMHEVILPKLGQTMEAGVIVEWHKREGEPVRRGDVLYTVESDKAALEVEAPAPGFLRRIIVPPGERAEVLTVVGLITSSPDEDISLYTVPAGAVGQPATSAHPREPELVSDGARGAARFASPRARQRAVKEGVDLKRVAGTGPNGRIEERDVLAYLKAQPKVTPLARRVAEAAGLDLRTLPAGGSSGRITRGDVERVLAPASSAPAPAPSGTPEGQPFSGVRSVIARRMVESHQTSAPVTLTTEADASALVDARGRLREKLAERLGFDLGYNDLLIAIAARALRQFPSMNVRLDDGGPAGPVIRQMPEVNIGLAVDTDRCLLVPVLRGADGKGLVAIARETRDLVERARSGKVLPDELADGTFTITNLGMYEIDAFTPILNLPETAILGVGRIKDRAAVVDGQICVRPFLWLSLTFDHRIVDGAPAARFLQGIKQLVEEPYLLLA